jgi:hypothetical protein
VLLQMFNKKLIRRFYLQRKKFESEVHDLNLPGYFTRPEEKGVGGFQGMGEAGRSRVVGMGIGNELPAYEEKGGLVRKDLR